MPALSPRPRFQAPAQVPAWRALSDATAVQGMRPAWLVVEGRTVKRDLQKLITYAQGRGWTATTTRNGHIRLRHPNGALIYTGSTPSDHRAVRNAAADIRRAERLTQENMT
jgi:hypothetical protein